MTPEQLKAIHDKLDELIREVRTIRHEAHRHGSAIADHEARIEDLEDSRPHAANGATE